MDKLARHYPLEKTRIDKILLRYLPTAHMVSATTLVIPDALH